MLVVIELFRKRNLLQTFIIQSVPRLQELHMNAISIRGRNAAARILKDVVMFGGYQEAEVDFVADNPGFIATRNRIWTAAS